MIYDNVKVKNVPKISRVHDISKLPNKPNGVPTYYYKPT